ncbi:MAG: 5-deoxy-glucuronate isomerase [Rhodobacteraceae bacterium]|nr:5-deoxy-glucuronate isomerase [Paracoccaceae bacterium]
MSKLLRRPSGAEGRIHAITPDSAGWRYVGFEAHVLAEGQGTSVHTGSNECIAVIVEGMVEIAVNGESFGCMGERLSPFEKKPPHAVYAPSASVIRARSASNAVLAFCLAPAKRKRPARRIGPEGVDFVQRGLGSNYREIFNIAMEDRDVADSLLVTEVFTPHGHWSSYPPHRHDEDNFPEITYLEETYYHRFKPSQGFGFQRVFTDDGSLDETITVHDHDVVLVPRGHHPCGSPFGYEMYYLNVMAGPLRKWRFKTHPQHDWLADFDPSVET